MTKSDFTSIRKSWSQLTHASNEIGHQFYYNLFKLDPALKSLFKGDIDEQANKLIVTLNLAVTSLDSLEILIPMVSGFSLAIKIINKITANKARATGHEN